MKVFERASTGHAAALGIIVVILALVGAVKFTRWHPERARARPTA